VRGSDLLLSARRSRQSASSTCSRPGWLVLPARS